MRSADNRPSFAVIMANAAEEVRERLDAVYRAESRRILATLIRLLGDFDLAEDALCTTPSPLHWNDGRGMAFPLTPGPG